MNDGLVGPHEPHFHDHVVVGLHRPSGPFDRGQIVYHLGEIELVQFNGAVDEDALRRMREIQEELRHADERQAHDLVREENILANRIAEDFEKLIKTLKEKKVLDEGYKAE